MNVKSIEVFGYKVIILSRSKNEKYGLFVGKQITREEMGSYTLYTKGLIQGLEIKTNTAIRERKPGTFSSDLLDPPKGRYVLTVVEESEQWCLDKKSNKEKYPSNVTVIDMKENDSTSLPEGKKMLVCLGSGSYGDLSLEPESSFISNGKDKLVANSRILAMIIED